MKNNWERKKIGEVCKLSQGLAINVKTKHYLVEKSDLPLLRIKDLKNNTVEQYVDPNNYPKNCLVTEKDLIYTRTGQIGLVFTGRFGILHNNSFKIEPDKSLLREYLFWFLQSESFKNQILKLASRTAQPDITHKIFKEQIIFVPPISEQKRIVAILDEAFEGIDRAIANTEKNLANSRELFESYLNSIFTQKNNRWEWISLSEITTDITDGDHQPPPKSQSGIPFITISNIDKQNRKVDFSNTFKVPPEYFEKLKSNRKPRKGDLLYTVTGSYGIPVIVDHDIDFCFQRHIGLIRPNAETNSKCLYYILLSRYLLAQADECATGTAQKTVSLSGLRRFSVPKIPKEQQEIIVAELDALSEKIGRLETIYRQKIAALNELKQSILQKAFTGELTADTPKTAKQEMAA
ncbi:restriction endonuclease subunit S [Nostoc sp. FACHB-152]|uniref:restriction endonuclease subunit S n=1 Tax=unclassified Nostoc TaxID=2593658 RepID=UPI001689950C|nr:MULTISPECIES: restriction endonuclease subunit S [unclassified Nostoc]MBD2447529.1 restriction endonuclease subunit S [Nostoc sp. FACHB-152]MBD2469299.1 restriction endonuclease subunit S [Nostoc sp. FACHB-145]